MDKKYLFLFLVMILSSSFVSAISPYDADNILYYSLDNVDLSGSNPLDLTPNNHDGTSVNLNTGQTLILNEAFSFNANGYVDVNNGLLTNSDDFSIAFWIKTTSSTFSVLATNGKADSGNLEGIAVNLGGAGYIEVALGNELGTGHFKCERGTTIVDDGNPHFVVVRWDGSNIGLFVDGSDESGTCWTTQGGSYYTGDTDFFFGNQDIVTYPTDRRLNGFLDEISVWNRSLSNSDITDLYANGTPTSLQQYPFSVAGNQFFAFNGTGVPLDGHSFSQTYMNFSQNATIINNTVNCSLILDGSIEEVKQYSNLSNESYFFSIDYDVSNITAPGEYNWSISCFSIITNLTYDTGNQTFYLDDVFPSISTDFVNNSVFFRDNLTAQINFSDDFYLNSYNVSINGVSVASNDSLTGTTAQLNLSVNITSLDPGLHTLTIQLADGHTAHKIPDYEVSNGLFGDRLEYGWKDSKGRSKSVRIKNSDSSIFDTFTTEKGVDRYTWNFEPSDKKDTYYFDIDADDDIRIIEANETYLGSWITFGNKWMDFDLYGENSSVKITRLGNNRVKVKISNIKNPDKQKYQSIGDLNIIEVNYTFYKVNATLDYQALVFEGAFTSLGLTLETFDILNLNTSANLVWHNISQNISSLNVSDDVILYGATLLVPDDNVSNISWTWFFNVSDYQFNVSGMSELIQMNITNCSAGDYIVLNYTIYDEGTQFPSTNINASIENFLTITTPDFDESSYNFSILEPTDNLLICLPNSTLNVSSWILNALTKYTYEDHVEEFHYIDNFLLNSSVIPKAIKLYDLATADSTSFVVTYQNENYIYVEGVVIDLLRQYTSLNGEFFSVEHGKTDAGGQTTLHLVTEDVIYKANVFQDGVLVYTSGEFQAICQATPCQINLRKPYDNTEGISFLSNIYYTISSQSEFYASKIIVFDFSTTDGTSTKIDMEVTKTTSSVNETICSSTKTLSSGSIVCPIPPSFYNATYTARIYKDGDFLGWRTYSLEPNEDDTFGRTGVFLAGLGYLMLSFMAISSAIASVVLGIVGLMAMISMNLLIGGSFFGVGSTFIWLIIAGGILIWKYAQRRVQ
jgi:hypothetical protein